MNEKEVLEAVNRGRAAVYDEVEMYLFNEMKSAVQSADWNRERGFLTEAYGWECKIVFIQSMAQDHRMVGLSNCAERYRVSLRDQREEAQRKVAHQ